MITIPSLGPDGLIPRSGKLSGMAVFLPGFCFVVSGLILGLLASAFCLNSSDVSSFLRMIITGCVCSQSAESLQKSKVVALGSERFTSRLCLW